MRLVRAAGGVLWRQGPGGPRLALVHRPLHADWSLPKGKVDAAESWRSAAVREVTEETGCDAVITGFAGAKLFVEREVPKLVLYWHMRVVRDGSPEDDDEVDEVAWLSARHALARLDSSSDRQLLARAHPAPGVTRSRGIRTELLRDLLVVDGRRAEHEIGPFLRLIERTARVPGSLGRPAAATPRSARR
jgi:8-oxo-dGTP pyrophosphatase MutT (NUDIX family)